MNLVDRPDQELATRLTVGKETESFFNPERVEPMVLKLPVHKGYEKTYPWMGLLLGAAVGFLIVHPLTMVVHEIYNTVYFGLPFQVGQALLISFFPQMWPMTLLYTVLGMIVGGVIGIFLKRLQEHRQQIQSLHQEFEVQVAALRHHYKNLAIGIPGFSSRLRRKLEAFDDQLHQCALDKVPHCHELHQECQALTSNADILEGTAQRLTTTLNQEVRFLKALTSDVVPLADQEFYSLLIHAIKDLLELRFREKEIRVDINNQPLDECHDSLVFAFEPYAMEVILQNLLSNSMRYGDHIQVAVTEAGNWVRVEVRDNGPGLEVEKLQSNLMAPTDREGAESTHLGLRVSLHLILKNRGRLSVRSNPGAGASFILEVPKQPSPSRKHFV
jgi:signal transduction histidine kinase